MPVSAIQASAKSAPCGQKLFYNMLTKYSNIVFDLGGVLLDIDRDRCVNQLLDLGLKDAAQLLDLYCQSGDFLALEQGLMKAGEFFDILRSKSNPGTTDAMITEALCSFICNLPVHRLQALEQLRAEGKRLFVLSNTNPIMFHSVIDRLFRSQGRSINDYFDGVVVSFQEKLCKPSPDIFRLLLNRYSLDPAETLFIDDSAANCRAAEALGISTVMPDPQTEFSRLIGISYPE